MIINVDNTVIAQCTFSNGIIFVGSQVGTAIKNLHVLTNPTIITPSTVLILYYDENATDVVRAVMVNELETREWSWKHK